FANGDAKVDAHFLLDCILQSMVKKDFPRLHATVAKLHRIVNGGCSSFDLLVIRHTLQS
ncbi:uncharacterized protein LOC129594446, partial [Paramacrobiotus metropolitanus]|uniref:uncharacterized protein LOC129594446 n=1 Tax=Paramacrobiotus metropolitanus TaxID=2943436 RepID=UPI002445A462